MAKLLIMVMLVVLSAVAAGVTEAQEIPSCASKLVPCADYLNSTTKPPDTCCNPIKQAVTNELDCLCKLYNDPNLLKAFNINVSDALRLTKNCGINSDLSACKSSAPSPASVPPPPGQPGSDGGAADRVAWTGITSLLLFFASVMLY